VVMRGLLGQVVLRIPMRLPSPGPMSKGFCLPMVDLGDGQVRHLERVAGGS